MWSSKALHFLINVARIYQQKVISIIWNNNTVLLQYLKLADFSRYFLISLSKLPFSVFYSTGILLFGAGPSKLETEGHKNNRVITANLHCTKAQTVIWWNEHRFLSPVRLWRQNYNSGRRWWAKNVFNQLHKVEMAKMIDTKSALNSILCLAPW